MNTRRRSPDDNAAGGISPIGGAPTWDMHHRSATTLLRSYPTTVDGSSPTTCGCRRRGGCLTAQAVRGGRSEHAEPAASWHTGGCGAGAPVKRDAANRARRSSPAATRVALKLPHWTSYRRTWPSSRLRCVPRHRARGRRVSRVSARFEGGGSGTMTSPATRVACSRSPRGGSVRERLGSGAKPDQAARRRTTRLLPACA